MICTDLSEQKMDLPANQRLNITISPSHFKMLAKWAAFHGKQPGEYAAQILASRIEANLDLIFKLDETRKELLDEPDVTDE